MKVVSLFTGAGGLDLGLHQVLREHFPGTLLVPDVCGLQSLPECTELLAAGFPCIDVSRIGLRKGLQGQATGLVRHVFRLLKDSIDKHHPVPWILLENVEALLDRRPGGPPPIKRIVDSLECLGYQNWAHRVVCSAAFGVPNRRRRVFLLASMHGDPRDVLLAQGAQPCTGWCMLGEGSKGAPCYECHQEIVEDKSVNDCSFALDLGNARSAPAIDVVPTFTTNNDRMCLLLSSRKMGMLRIEDAERLQGFPKGYTEPCFPVVGPCLNSHRNRTLKDGDADLWESKRFALIGNAVTVQVAKWIGERLQFPYKHKYVPSDCDTLFPKVFQNQHAPEQATCADYESDGNEGGLLWRCPKDRMAKSREEVNNILEQDEANSGLSSGSESVEVSHEAGDEMHTRKCEKYGCADMGSGTWPRAAWYCKGAGRHAITGLSDAPVKYPLAVLGDFVSEVGCLPGKHVINTYIMRLREQGWNVEEIVKKATRCGMSFAHEVANVVRLQGLPGDSESISDLVWGRCPIAGTWWPAEKLDPFRMPKGRTLPVDALLKLTPHERTHWLPRDTWKNVGHHAGEADNSLFGTTTMPRYPAEEDAGESVCVYAQETPVQGDSCRVLVVFFGDKSHLWLPSCELLPFEKHLDEITKEAKELQKAGLLRQPALFDQALEQAKTWLAVKKQSKGKKFQCSSALASRAAEMAAAANKRPRCGSCEACLNQCSGRRRRCLHVRAMAAAEAGHTGAQLAVMGIRAIGAKVKVWWPLDEAWYKGQVTDYDRINLRHTLSYDDGDVEIIPLWAPNQQVQVISRPKDWPREAKKLLSKKQNRQRNATTHKSNAQGSHQQTTQLETARAANIDRNRAKLQDLMARDEKCDTMQSAKSTKTVATKKRKMEALMPSTPTPTCRLTRAAHRRQLPEAVTALWS